MAQETEHFESPVLQDNMITKAPRELTLRSGLATAGAALTYFTTVGFLNAYGVFQQYYTTEILRNISNFQISWIGSFGTFMFFACASAAGILANKTGPTLPIIFGSVCVLIAVFVISLCKEYYQFFLSQGVLLGLGMSFVAVPASGVVPRYFKRHRGLATGISIAGSSLGGVVWPIVCDQLLHHDNISFAWTMRIVGFMMIPLLALAVTTVRPPVVKHDTARYEARAGHDRASGIEKEKDVSFLRNPAFWLLCLGLSTAFLGFFSPYFFISTYAVNSLKMSPSLAFYLVCVLNGASTFGRVLPCLLADRTGRINVLFAAALFAGIITFCWTTAQSSAGVFIFSAAYGFASGSILSLQIACVTSLTSPKSMGASVGIIMGSCSITALFGTPIAGELVKRGYLAVASFSGAVLLLGAAFIACARFCQSKALLAKI